MYRSDLGRIDLCITVLTSIVLNHATLIRQLPPPEQLAESEFLRAKRRDCSKSTNKALLRNLYHVPATYPNYDITYKPSLIKPTDRRVAANRYKPFPETTPAFASSLATKLGLYSGTPHKIQCPDSARANTRGRYKSIRHSQALVNAQYSLAVATVRHTENVHTGNLPPKNKNPYREPKRLTVINSHQTTTTSALRNFIMQRICTHSPLTYNLQSTDKAKGINIP